MQLEINSRGNGACPLCNANGNCRAQDTIAKAVAVFADENDPMELVVYSCPLFREKTEGE